MMSNKHDYFCILSFAKVREGSLEFYIEESGGKKQNMC